MPRKSEAVVVGTPVNGGAQGSGFLRSVAAEPSRALQTEYRGAEHICFERDVEHVRRGCVMASASFEIL